METKEGVKNIIDCDADPFVPEGWTVEEHQKGGQFEWDPAQINLDLAVGADLNANVLDSLLAHKKCIPEEYKGKYIFFRGTTYRNSNDQLCFRCLCWFDDDWRWGDGRPDEGWVNSSPAARRKN